MGLFLLLSLVGCQRRSTNKFARPQEMERYSQLALARASHDPKLRAELARIVSEGGTPAQLADPADSARSIPGVAPSNGISAPVRPVRNGMVTELAEIFPADVRDSLGNRLATVYPDARFQFAPFARGTARQVLESAESRRRDYQRLMATGKLEPTFPHALGLGADSSYLSAVEVGNRLLGISVAEMLDAGQSTQAVESLLTMFRAVEWLASEKHTLPRLKAVQLRSESLAALGAIARHPQTRALAQRQLLESITRQLSNWPPDADAWIGDRAEGLHTYELVRDGYLLSILPFEDLRRLREEVGVEKLAKIVADNLDADELYFLTTMRQIIAACAQPYYQRTSLFRSIEADLEERRSTDQYPFIADQLLLLELEERQRLIAVDRARCEAWRIALAVVTQGATSSEVTLNPLTGEPFSITGSPTTVVVAGFAPYEPPIELPLRSASL